MERIHQKKAEKLEQLKQENPERYHKIMEKRPAWLDKKEDVLDRREDARDHKEDILDRREAARDHREDIGDRKENRLDRRENIHERSHPASSGQQLPKRGNSGGGSRGH